MKDIVMTATRDVELMIEIERKPFPKGCNVFFNGDAKCIHTLEFITIQIYTPSIWHEKKNGQKNMIKIKKQKPDIKNVPNVLLLVAVTPFPNDLLYPHNFYPCSIEYLVAYQAIYYFSV